MYKQHYLHLSDPVRRSFAAMTEAVDEGVGQVVSALKRKGVWDNTGMSYTY